MRVEKIVGSEVVRNVEVGSLSEFIVEAVESIQEIFQSLDIFNTFELSNSTSNIVAVYFINFGSNESKSIFPFVLCEVSSVSDKRYS